MGRVACLGVPALPLQILLLRHPHWAGLPAAVVERDHPQGRILWTNGRARQRRILPGMRYAAALALERELVAGTVGDEECAAAAAVLQARLEALSPAVEAIAGEPGIFLLDASGLAPERSPSPEAVKPPGSGRSEAARGHLWPSLAAWARQLGEAAAQYQGVGIAVGWSRFGSWALARALSTAAARPSGRRGTAAGTAIAAGVEVAGPRIRIYADAAAQQRALDRVPLAWLDLEPTLRDSLNRLGVRDLGGLRRLPEAGLAERFGIDALRLHQRAHGRLDEPLVPQRPRPPLAGGLDLEQPDGDATRLLFLGKRLLDSLLTALARRGEAVACLHCSLRLEDGSRRHEILTPARPTRDGPQLLELLRLRLEAVELPCRVEELRLEVEPGRLDDGGTVQAELFPVAGPGGGARDAEAGARALARLRAELGDAAVVRARLADRWLPEGSFLWEPLGPRAALLPAPPSATEDPPLVRRIYSVARALPPRPRHLRDDGWLIRGAEHGAVMRLIGPYSLSGGWWFGGAERDYYYAETRPATGWRPAAVDGERTGGGDGELLWTYFDRRLERWFLQGVVA